MKKYPLGSYFFLTFLLMWSLSSFGVFKILINITDYPFLYILGSWTPTIAAIIVTLVAYGSKSTINLVKGWFIWKVPFWYYIIALLPLFIMFIFGLLYSVIIIKEGISIDSNFSILSLLELILFCLILGPTGEEAGWRGFALRFLQKRYNVIIASLFLGIIWSVWHLPMWFIEGFEENQTPFWLFTVDHIFRTIFLTWIFNSTKGSLLLVGLLHLSQNLAMHVLIVLFKSIPMDIGYISMVIIYAIIAVTILIIWGSKNLSTNNNKEQKIPEC